MAPTSSAFNQFSSGDVLADRRVDYARMLAEAGDHAAAAELIEQALELSPHWAAGWFMLGEYREKAGRPDAADAYRQTLELEPEDVFGATLKLALLGEESVPDLPPSGYIESLFDDYADRFDTALVEKLNYSVPEKLAALIAPHAPFDHVVDLGCGTGLLGEAIRSSVTRLEGFDISANMLVRAEQKAIYDHLGQADLSLPHHEAGLFSKSLALHRADLVSAADVLMYLGSLETVFPLVTALLRPNGLFAFSVEDAGPDGGFVLRESLRYAHSQAYIEMLLAQHGFTLAELQRTVIRTDGGNPVRGILFLSRLGA
ncbi:methyltransferase domain-containing protein [Rhizobium sp. NTR19]|uniref:Methyltransferase domain-containing protein n=1 Tax=Neorhizobium turbinariae TaxID=2937795 RepID=A0ABT0IQS3_9HYPH|nr:methyltransferase [Neorhizobium turbinariae]MCK8780237.1 methyltransferase domain-containing protein [Neorhizobium turbinariae]